MNGRSIAVLIGIAFMVIALIIESAIESIPPILEILKYGLKQYATHLASFELSNALLYSVFIGLAAGISQETMKYIAVDTRGKALAMWIGLGFAVVDILFLIATEMLGGVSKITTEGMIFIILNILFSLLFHPGTAAFLKAGRLIGRGGTYLVVAFLIHAAVDGGLVLADIEVILYPHLSFSIPVIYWLVAFPISIIVMLTGRFYLSRSEEKPSLDTTVF